MSRDFAFPVEHGHVLAFARAIGEPRDDLVPPTFAAAADQFDPGFDRRPPLGQGWSGGAPASHLHVEQHFEYARPLEIGELLHARRGPGRRWSREGRTGHLDFIEERTELLDRHGEVVVIARWVDVHSDHSHAALTQRQTATRPKPESSDAAPVPGVVVVSQITRTQFVMYVGAAGDFHPLHHDDTFAHSSGHPSVFAPGMLTMALTGRVITTTIAIETLQRFSGRFRAQVWPGDTLFVESRAHRRDDSATTVAVTTRNQNGVVVFEGEAGR